MVRTTNSSGRPSRKMSWYGSKDRSVMNALARVAGKMTMEVMKAPVEGFPKSSKTTDFPASRAQP